MKVSTRLFIQGLCLCLLGLSPALGMAETASTCAKAEATPAALESQFVTFKPNFPLLPGSLNLYGYETLKAVRGYPILSPDRTQMAVTEVFFMSNNRQTSSRVFLYPTGNQPSLYKVMPLDKLEAMEQDRETNQAQNPDYVPRVNLEDVDPHAFWERYDPQKQIAGRQVIFESGFDGFKSFRSDLVQVIDWSSDGSRLLLLYRPGMHHMGIWKTIPILYQVDTGEVTRLMLLPELVWRDMLRRYPELKSPTERVWDIRPLGWNAQSPEEIVVKLVMFEGQSEKPAGFWSYSVSSGMLQYLGDSISEEAIARNGWLVSFKDPNNPEGPKNYEPGETPPSEKQYNASRQRRSWGDRLQFWKKQR